MLTFKMDKRRGDLMAKDLFYNLDLNLLRTFLVLSQELNMRKASERLSVSQPAISQALTKLRHHFNDPLFIKVSTGLEATDFSISLATKVTPHLDGLANAINTAYSFSPENIDFTLKIALSPVVLSCLSGALYRELKAQAPNAQLELLTWTAASPNDIRKGEVLLGVSYELEKLSKEVYLRKLTDLRGQIFVRKDHPLKKKVITPMDLGGYEIASMITPGWNDNFSYASKILTEYNVEHKVGFRSELIMAIIDVVLHTDMYLPHTNIFPIDNYPSLRAIDVLIEDKPHTYPIYSYIHLKNRNNPLLTWLHSIIQSVLYKQVNK